MAVLAAAGIEVVGENRLQDLIAKHGRFADVFRWHFIGHLQSRKARDVSRLCELVHSLDSVSAAQRLTVPALVEVNLSGEETKSGVAPEEIGAYVAAYPTIRGLMTMPPATGDAESSRPHFRRLRSLAAELEEAHRLLREEGILFLGVNYVDTEREFGRLLDELSARLRNRPERRLQPSACPGQS